jgi:hypothetical protein
MSKKRESVHGKGKGIAVFTAAPTDEKEEKKTSRDIEPKKSRIIYEQANYQLYPEQAQKIREYAVKHKMKVSEVVRQALEEFFKKAGV